MQDEIPGEQPAGEPPPFEWPEDATTAPPSAPAKPNGSKPPRPRKPRLASIDGNTALAVDPDDAPLPAQFGDDALADEWVRQHGADWRHVEKWDAWFHWNGSHWKRVEGNAHFNLARIITREALLWPGAGELSRKEKRSINSASMAASMLRQAKFRPEIDATIEQWDADPFALATPDGVIDLRAGKLIEASREQYCTRCTSVAPERGPMPTWEKCLKMWFGGDSSLIKYTQLFCGYCLTGDTSEKMFLFVHGPADGGKSKFVEAIQNILGTYAQSASMETFSESKHERHTTELAELAGARFVAAPETEEGTRWNQSRINALTGKDRIRARFMRQDNFEFLPQFKLLVYGNNAPHLKNVDSAMRRRLHILPFPHSIPREEQDSQLAGKLQAEYPAILQWMLDGCIEWQELRSLTMPEAISEATEKYLESEDSFGAWIEDRLERDQYAFSSNGDLAADYRAYCDQNGDPALGSKRFGQQLEQRGFARGKSADGTKRGFRGCRLKPKPL